MKKTILTLAFGLMASSDAATATARDGLYCGHNGFSVDGGAGKSFRCGVSALTRGTFPISTTSGLGTATSAGAFPFAASDATAVVDNTAFSITGLAIYDDVANIRYWFRVSAKASSSSITIAEGGATPTITGSWREWSYWTTTCYRSGNTFSVPENSTVANALPLSVWGLLGASSLYPGQAHLWVHTQPSTIATTSAAGFYRSTAFMDATGENLSNFATISATPGHNEAFGVTTVLSPVSLGIRVQIAIASTAAASVSYPVACMMRVPLAPAP